MGGYSDYGRTIVAEAMRVMLDADGKVKTRRIVEAIEAKGIEISGENKVNAIGALLSRSMDIESHGKSGWTLLSRNVAEELVAAYGHNENGPPEGGPDTGEVGASPLMDRLHALAGALDGSNQAVAGNQPGAAQPPGE